MELIEFFQATKQKNIKNSIGMKVKEKLREYEEVLQERQQKLRDILEFENTQYNEELVGIVNEQLTEQFAKRLQWINTTNMERVKAEEELLKLKNQQRELENCENWRHLQSKQLLLDSKKGQLYQIEDKKLRIQREKDIDEKWHKVMERLNAEKEFQEIYEAKLLRAIAGTNQLKNQETDYSNKRQQELECQEAKKQFQEENHKALYMEEKYRKDKQRSGFLEKEHYKQLLKSQISSNSEKRALESQLLLEETRLQNEVNDRKFLTELEEAERQKIRNKEWHKYYLRNTIQEKQQQIDERSEFDQMYLNTGCVLQQGPKKPYGKNIR